MRKKATIVPGFEKAWSSKLGRFVYAPRKCPYCTNGVIMVYGGEYKCAACNGSSTLFVDGNPTVKEKLLAAAPSVYAERVRTASATGTDV